MLVSEVGEFGLIDRIAALLAETVPTGGAVALGIGDDAAVWRPSSGTDVVISVDTLVEGVHFRFDLMDWVDVGFRALAANLSDLAAMGAHPGAAVVSLSLRPTDRVEAILDLYRGMGELARRWAVPIVGGDIVATHGPLSLTVTVLGEAQRDATGTCRVLRRDAAQPGDLVAVTGALGLSAAGLALLLAAGADGGLSSADEPFIRAYRRPVPRLTAGQAAVKTGVRAGMDLSDGLAGDLLKLCARSGLSAEIEEARLPVPATLRERFPTRWLSLALRGGEDFELLLAVPPTLLDPLNAALRQADEPPVVVIGRFKEAAPHPLWLVRADGARQPLLPGAFDHFAAVPSDPAG